MSKDSKVTIAKRAAMELKDGWIVNLGVGIPTLAVNYLPPGRRVFIQSENGILGVGPMPAPEEADPDIINAGRQPVTIIPGGSFFDSALSFGMIRGGHLDATIIGALEVSERGDIANWILPGKDVLGMGGAMDLVVGAKKVIVATQHVAKSGKPKILPECTLPLTAPSAAHMIITEYAVFSFQDGVLVLDEIAPDITLDGLKEITPAKYEVSPELKVMEVC
ncbi:acyl CoA:acetate/3-ketoacid CoA transferase, beta subunit [Pelotomaculum thermopropionicum SI]|uniref:Acyl CoA:acetate/3-ketoacid CoA transferase, beta subunit n=1 Tax=Pelotomaculum thermopropionicum (strain DSM 13744 / JCM 10971 / SI) TaxID=370438 RepID=A5D5M8_PELTS|nr:acyl CoA:acetate/3-ketoacid CoA transferase, beta subunit [Pelotomaculum thermopropionicum SI]